MAIPYKKYRKNLKLRRNKRRGQVRIDPRLVKLGHKVKRRDLTEEESKISELMVSGDVPTKRKEDGTVVLREVTDDEGN